MDAGNRHGGVSFEPARPASQSRKVALFLLGALVWIVAGVLAVVLLGHTYILRHLLLAVTASWCLFGVALICGRAMRRREERRELRGAP